MAHQAEYPVGRMCQVLEVTTSGYYAWRRRQSGTAGWRQAENEQLVAEMQRIAVEAKGRYIHGNGGRSRYGAGGCG